jgi:NADPH-dependent curcumin reductase CurA|tara:strand:+ start:33460 stop:34482 length:1023 start_codon:yes stop_codon:yes gene_type:complete
MISKQVRLSSEVSGAIKVEDFTVLDVEIPELQEGQVLVENKYLSTDPYVRSTMIYRPNNVFNTMPGEPIQGDAVGTVIESKNSKFPVGTNLLHRHGWRTHTILSEEDDNEFTKVIPDNHKLLDYLSIYGLVGVTAYFSLTQIKNLTSEDTIVIDGATGGVGHLFVQFAKLMGLQVYGVTSTQEKVDYIDNIGGVGVLLPAKGGLARIHKLFEKNFPNGIDYYHANVDNERFAVGVWHLNNDSDITMCGGMKHYNSVMQTLGPNIQAIIHKNAHIHGCAWRFSIDEWRDEYLKFIDDNYENIVPLYEFREGIDSMPQQYVDQFFIYDTDSNKKFGKLITQL